MNSIIMGLYAETSLHPGTGQVAGAIDLPVAREKTTGYPVIVGSSLKGALRDCAEQNWRDENRIKRVFGAPDAAGEVSISDARLLLLPVRSLNGHFKWVTCPYLLERYQRDRHLSGVTGTMPPLPPLGAGQAAAAGGGSLFLEELSFEVVQTDLTLFAEQIAPLVYHLTVRERLAKGLVLVSDDEFSYFARFGLAVNARNVLDNEKKTSQNLWYEETVPPEALFYALLLARPGKQDALRELTEIFDQRPYIQVGGNETVGQGWCAVSWLRDGGEPA